jgi:hypothetical protein
MKNFRFVLCAITAGAIFGSASPAFAGDDGDAMKQAEDLVKQAWNPGGDPPSNDDRTQLITKAITLAQSEPDHNLRGQRVLAIRELQLAIETIKAGGPDSKVTGLLQEADRDLRTAIGNAESHS